VIQQAFLTSWRTHAPWALDAQVEQDLVLARALVELFRDDGIRHRLVFRGGTALHKLFFDRPLRFSEDIDLVQAEAGPIGEVMDGVHRCLDSWLGRPQWKQGQGRVTFCYRFRSETEPAAAMRLKVEVNTREHFSVLGTTNRRLNVENPWFQGTAEIPTYPIEELLGTKLRALFQRKKGRDLFDLWAASQRVRVDLDIVADCFHRYLEHEGHAASRAEFEANLHGKLADPGFGRDVEPLVAPGVEWDLDAAGTWALREIAPRLRGQPWRRPESATP